MNILNGQRRGNYQVSSSSCRLRAWRRYGRPMPVRGRNPAWQQEGLANTQAVRICEQLAQNPRAARTTLHGPRGSVLTTSRRTAREA